MLRKRGYVIEARRKKQEDPETVKLREMVNEFCAKNGGRRIGISTYSEIETRLGRAFVSVRESDGALKVWQDIEIKFDKPVDIGELRKTGLHFLYSEFGRTIHLSAQGSEEGMESLKRTMKDLL